MRKFEMKYEKWPLPAESRINERPKRPSVETLCRHIATMIRDSLAFFIYRNFQLIKSTKKIRPFKETKGRNCYALRIFCCDFTYKEKCSKLIVPPKKNPKIFPPIGPFTMIRVAEQLGSFPVHRLSCDCYLDWFSSASSHLPHLTKLWLDLQTARPHIELHSIPSSQPTAVHHWLHCLKSIPLFS